MRYLLLTLDGYFLLFTITVNWVAKGTPMFFELVQRFLSYFMLAEWGAGMRLTGARWKGLKMVALKVSDRWLMKPLRPATTVGSSTHQDRSSRSNASLSCVCRETSTHWSFLWFIFLSHIFLALSWYAKIKFASRDIFYKSSRGVKFYLAKCRCIIILFR